MDIFALFCGVALVSSAGQETIATFRPKSEHFLIAFQQRSRATVCGECTHSMHYLPLRNIQGLYYFLMMVLQKKGKMSFWFAPLLLSDCCTKYIHHL